MRRVAAMLAAGGLLLAAGCADGSAGQAEPAPDSAEESDSGASPSSSAADKDLPHSGAPDVSNPLPESVVSGDPCEALTSEQLQRALGDGVTGKRDDSEEAGPGCHWSNAKEGSGILLGFHTATGQGLSASYAYAQPRSDHFAAIDPVQGFPAVEYSDGAGDNTCSVVVGLANEYSVNVTGTLGYESEEAGNDSCESTAKVADMAVGNLKDKAGGQ